MKMDSNIEGRARFASFNRQAFLFMPQLFVVIGILLCLCCSTFAESTNVLLKMPEQIRVLANEGKFKEALPFAQQWTAMIEREYGRSSTNRLLGLETLADLYGKDGDGTNALASLQEALAIQQQHFGLTNQETARTINQIGLSLLSMGDYTNALFYCSSALTMRQQVLGSNHIDTARSSHNVGLAYEHTANYRQAIGAFQMSLALYQTHLDPDDPDFYEELKNVGNNYCKINQYGNAGWYFQKTIPIVERKYGAESTNTAAAYEHLGFICEQFGQYSNAVICYNRSLKINEKVLGVDSTTVASTLNNLGRDYTSLEQYSIAEKLLQRSLSINEKVLGPNHLSTLATLKELAGLFFAIGDKEKAEYYWERIFKATEELPGNTDGRIAEYMLNIGAVYYTKREYKKAERAYLRAMEIISKKTGDNSAATSVTKVLLGTVYAIQKDYSKAMPSYRQGVRGMELTSGMEQPSTKAAQLALAMTYNWLGDFTNAEVMFQRAKPIGSGIGAGNHSSYYQQYALLKFELGKTREAEQLMETAKEAEETKLANVLSFMTERQRFAFQERNLQYTCLSALCTIGQMSAISEHMVRCKGLVLDSMLEDIVMARLAQNSEMKATLEQLRAARKESSKLDIKIKNATGVQNAPKEIENKAEIDRQVEKLEKALAVNSSSLGQPRRALSITVPQVQTALAEGTALVEFIRYNHYTGKGIFELRYGAALIGGTQSNFKDAKQGEPVWVPLGSAKEIEQNLKEYALMMRGQRRGDVKLLHKIYAQSFAPIQSKLPKETTTLIISPDAELNFVSFATFLDDKDQFLAEQYAIKYVASGRDLLFGKKLTTGERTLAAFSNPSFSDNQAIGNDTNAVQVAMLGSDQRDYAGVTLGPLTNTLQETDFLRENSQAWKLKTKIYAGRDATEAEVKAVKSPYILHLATHGFFLPDTQTNNQANGLQMPGQQASVVLQNPMQRSALAFAGAQVTLDAWKRGEVPNTENDGILMAQEVGLMDLKDTWLVVLSACDTGIGEARAGEGVLGLRRGFIQAGTQNLLMTLWPVSDRWTVELMKSFYEKALKDGNAPGSLALVQREYLVKLKKEKGPVLAARLAGPFVMTFQGSGKN